MQAASPEVLTKAWAFEKVSLQRLVCASSSVLAFMLQMAPPADVFRALN
jgi:hypothetical protein